MNNQIDFEEMVKDGSLTVSKFGEEHLDAIMRYFANKRILFTNEAQFQLDLAVLLERIPSFKGHVKLEVVSCGMASPYFKAGGLWSKTKNIVNYPLKKSGEPKWEKYYTDIVIENPDDKEGDIAIELKYKTMDVADCLCPKEMSQLQKINNVTYRIGEEMIPVFSQGAADLGSYQYLEDIERLERLVCQKERKVEYEDNLTFGFAGRKVQKGFAIIMSNCKTYWAPKRENSLSKEFYCLDGVFSHGEHYWQTFLKREANGTISVYPKGHREGIKPEEVTYCI